jgi:hypothetical protein
VLWATPVSIPGQLKVLAEGSGAAGRWWHPLGAPPADSWAPARAQVKQSVLANVEQMAPLWGMEGWRAGAGRFPTSADGLSTTPTPAGAPATPLPLHPPPLLGCAARACEHCTHHTQ